MTIPQFVPIAGNGASTKADMKMVPAANADQRIVKSAASITQKELAVFPSLWQAEEYYRKLKGETK